MLNKTKTILKFLKDIDTGKVTLTSPLEPQYVYAGHVPYQASNGWKVVLFNDCNEWDYIDRIVMPDGVVAYGELRESKIGDWAPNEDTLWRIWGIPGYLCFKRDLWSAPTKQMKEFWDCKFDYDSAITTLGHAQMPMKPIGGLKFKINKATFIKAHLAEAIAIEEKYNQLTVIAEKQYSARMKKFNKAP